MALLGLGILFLAITPLLGPLPGPGGIFTFAIGAGLVLRNSMWARRRYVAFKKAQPKLGSWADWSLRRKSALRRDARDGRPNPGSELLRLNPLAAWWRWMNGGLPKKSRKN